MSASPRTWENRPLFSVADLSVSTVDKLSADGEQPVRLCNYTDVYKHDTVNPGLDLMDATATASEVRRFRLLVGDTVFTKDSETADDIGVPAFVDGTADDFVCGYHLAVARPKHGLAHPKYLYWWLASREAARLWEVRASGVTRVGLRQADIARFPVALPPTIDDQRAVAHFLDRETAQIDALIEAQRELVDRLHERRLAVIQSLVLHGAGDSANLADSGIRWIGEVPKHWQVGCIRRFAQMHSGHTPSRQVADYWVNCNIPWFTLADVWQLRPGRQEYLGQTAEQVSELGLANSAAELLPAGTVVFSRTASVGFSGIMPVAMATSQDFWNWVCGSELLPEYLLYVFRAMKTEFEALRMGSTHQTIYERDAAGIHIPVPPTSEQREIVGLVRQSVARTDDMIDAASNTVALLQERRSALISAAVTGRIDPRTGKETLVDKVLGLA